VVHRGIKATPVNAGSVRPFNLPALLRIDSHVTFTVFLLAGCVVNSQS
jgi:hypothetical protein